MMGVLLTILRSRCRGLLALLLIAHAWIPSSAQGGRDSGVVSMNKEMIISASDRETRVAILEEDQVVEVFIEREHQRGVVGNIYKGRVSKVLPGMQSSFVDIGLERDAFLYVTEVVNTVEEFERLESGEDEDAEPGEPPARLSRPPPLSKATRPRRRPAALDRPRGRDRDRPQAKIEDLLKEGQEVLVQVVKEPLGTKGARLTSHATMPGRFLVFMPTVDHVGVSRKIESREERARLRGIVREFREQHGFTGGVIIRTAASGRSKEDIVSDLTYFHQVWTEIRQKMEGRRPPALAVPGAEPGHQAAAGPADRRLFGGADRQRAGVPARDGARRADHAQPAAAREALHEGLPDPGGVRRPGGDRQGAAHARCG